MRYGRFFLMIGLAALMWFAAADADAQVTRKSAVQARIKDITKIPKIRDNQLTGIGLVTGLNGTGDGIRATRQAIVNLLKKMDLNVSTVEVDA